MSKLTEALLALRDARVFTATAKDAVKAKRQAFEASIAAELDALTQAETALAEQEAIVRGLAVAVYLETGAKAPAEGVSVVESSKLKYDAAEAFAWAQEHKVALALDTKAFEKVAKATALPFVTTEVTPTARIATDLSILASA